MDVSHPFRVHNFYTYDHGLAVLWALRFLRVQSITIKTNPTKLLVNLLLLFAFTPVLVVFKDNFMLNYDGYLLVTYVF